MLNLSSALWASLLLAEPVLQALETSISIPMHLKDSEYGFIPSNKTHVHTLASKVQRADPGRRRR